jgi:hypothetical protein
VNAGGKLLVSFSAYLFDPEDGGDMFLRNVVTSQNMILFKIRKAGTPASARREDLTNRSPESYLYTNLPGKSF